VAVTENNKPEWFEIAENVGPAMPPKPSKTLPILPLRRVPTDGSGDNAYEVEDD
jgi:hypothetical protein